MAYVSQIKLRVELLQNLGEYTSIKPVYELAAELDEEDDETVVMEELEQSLFERVWGMIDRELQSRGEPAIYTKPNYFICSMRLPSIFAEGYIKAVVFGYATDYEKFLEWTEEFKRVVGRDGEFWIDDSPSYWLEPYGVQKFNHILLKERGYRKNILSIALIGPPDIRFQPLKELLEKYRPAPTPLEVLMKNNRPVLAPADVSNGYEEMEAVQQHSELNDDDEFEHPDDPDHDPFRHLHDQPLDGPIF